MLCDGQFCGNDADILLRAAEAVASSCSAIDLNLGCPQSIARRGNYGAFLLEQQDVVVQLVRTLAAQVGVPLWCKIRLFANVDDTVALALRLQDAGCSVLSVHGRTRHQNKVRQNGSRICVGLRDFARCAGAAILGGRGLDRHRAREGGPAHPSDQ